MTDSPTGQPPASFASNGSGVGSPVAAAAAGAGSIRINLFGRTDVGQIREHNEDNFLIADLTRKTLSLLDSDRVSTIGPHGTILGVCDGMGGAAAGEVASQLAVDIIFEKMSATGMPAGRDEFAYRLVQAVEAAGLRIFTEAKVDRARRGMGTTATIAGLIDNHLFLAQVGDSRGYVLRGDRLVQVTRDQSLVNQLIEAGQLTEAEAETFEHNNIILQALGTADTVQVDLTYAVLRPGDTLMLCSDGLSGMVRFDEIREILLTAADPFEACRLLIDRANQAGGHDNITVIVAKFDGPGLTHSPEEDLRYRKYSLPDSPFAPVEGPFREAARDPSGAAAAPGAATRQSSIPPIGERLSDHGPSRSKVTHTMVGGQMSQAAMAAIAAHTSGPPGSASQGPLRGDGWSDKPSRREDADPIFIPTQAAPTWMVGGVVLTALALALVAGYYLLR